MLVRERHMVRKRAPNVQLGAFIIAALLPAAPAIARAGDSPPLCRPNDAAMPGMMVPNKYVAESIYRAVGGALVPWNFRKYPNVVVRDEGDHWSVFQTIAPPLFGTIPSPAPKGDAPAVTTGGGQLHMDIDKCTAAISNAALAR